CPRPVRSASARTAPRARPWSGPPRRRTRPRRRPPRKGAAAPRREGRRERREGTSRRVLRGGIHPHRPTRRGSPILAPGLRGLLRRVGLVLLVLSLLALQRLHHAIGLLLADRALLLLPLLGLRLLRLLLLWLRLLLRLLLLVLLLARVGLLLL